MVNTYECLIPPYVIYGLFQGPQGANMSRQFFHIHGSQVMGVDVQGFGIRGESGFVRGDVEHGVGPADTVQVKTLDQLFPGENLLGVCCGPAQKHQEVDKGPGQESFFPVIVDGHHLTVSAFGYFGLFGVQGQGHMGKYRQGCSERPV